MNAIKGVFSFVLFFVLTVTLAANSQAAGSIGGSGIGGVSNRLPPHVGIGGAPYKWKANSVDARQVGFAGDDNYSYIVNNAYLDGNGNWLSKGFARAVVIEMARTAGTFTINTTGSAEIENDILSLAPMFSVGPSGVALGPYAVASGDVDIYGNLDVGGSVTSSKACATNFVRVTPNYCHATTDVGSANLSWATVGLSRDVCTAVAAPSVEARVIVVRTVATARAANAIAGRATAIEQHGTSACSGSLGDLSNASGYEFTAIPATTPVAADVSLIAIRPQAGAGGSIYLKMIDDAGNGGTASYAIVGYYD